MKADNWEVLNAALSCIHVASREGGAFRRLHEHVERAVHPHFRGTLAQNRPKLRRGYKLHVVCVPINQPVIRAQFNCEVAFKSTLRYNRLLVKAPGLLSGMDGFPAGNEK